MEQILRDESCILIPQDGKSPYVIERTNIRTDNDVQPTLVCLQQQPWATEEISLKVERLLKEWLDATYRRGMYAPNPERDAAAAAMLQKYAPAFEWDNELAAKFGYSHSGFYLQKFNCDGRLHSALSVFSLRWVSMIKLALSYGWIPEQFEGYYWPPNAQLISSRDAKALAVAVRTALLDVSKESNYQADTREGFMIGRISSLLEYLSGHRWVIGETCKFLTEGEQYRMMVSDRMQEPLGSAGDTV